MIPKLELISIYSAIDRNVFSAILIIGIIQAWLVNVLKVGIPILTIFILVHIVLRLAISRLTALKYFISRQALFFVFLFVMLLIYGTLISLESIKDLLYLLNVPIVIFWVDLIPKKIDNNLNLFFRFFLVYCLISFVIYFLYWDELANIIYKNSTGHLWGLKTSGIPRSFGLILNPLSNAYIILIGTCLYLYIKGKTGVTFFVFMLALALCLVRLSMITMLLSLLIYFIFQKKYLLLFIFSIIFIFLAISIEEVRTILVSILTLSDSKGSIQLHVEHFFYGINSLIEYPWGRGITDEHIESWAFRYALNFGILGMTVYLIWLLGTMLVFVLNKKIYEFLLLMTFVPIFVGIPFHSFNVPLILFFLFLRILNDSGSFNLKAK